MRKTNGILVMMVLSALFALAGCGGGGGSAEQVSWDGATDPAVLDTTNPTSWALTQYEETNPPGERDVILLSAEESSDPKRVARNLPTQPGRLGAYLRSVLASVPQGPIAAPQEWSPMMTDVLYGNVSGQITMSMKVELDTGAIFMEMVAADYADTTTGYLEEVDGTYILQGLEEDFEVIFRDFYQYYENGGEETLFDGSFSQTWSTTSTTEITHTQMDLAVVDFYSGESIWYHDWDFTEISDNDAETWSSSGSGRVYKGAEGYVDITVSPALTGDWYGTFPFSGAIKFSCASGRWAKLEFLSWSSYQVTACTNGDGIADFDSGEVVWN